MCKDNCKCCKKEVTANNKTKASESTAGLDDKTKNSTCPNYNIQIK